MSFIIEDQNTFPTFFECQEFLEHSEVTEYMKTAED